VAHRRHPRAKLTVEGRRLLVQRVCEQGWPVARAAEAQGVSRATAHKWLSRYAAEGDAGLVDRSSRLRRSPARLSTAREQAILAVGLSGWPVVVVRDGRSTAAWPTLVRRC